MPSHQPDAVSNLLMMKENQVVPSRTRNNPRVGIIPLMPSSALAVEVGDARLRPADDAGLHIPLGLQPVCENAQGDGLAGAGRAGDEGEAARQQKDSMRRLTCRASTGTSGAKGFHLRP